MPLAAGTQLGPYEILAPIGAGGMGEVYKARDTRLHRLVAIKVSKAQFSERFDREARAIAALNHPHICQLHDIGPNYLVMEFVEGAPIAPSNDFPKVIELAVQISDGLAAAHHRGIVHRDLKPGNILVTGDGQVKILDFGLALIASAAHPAQDDATLTMSLTAAGTTIGTVAYMSPEQARGQQVDARTDLWSLGVVLYEMVTGARPFLGPTAPVVFEALLAKAPVPLRNLSPSVPGELERIIGKLLEKDRGQRYASAIELRGDLKLLRRRLESGQPIEPAKGSAALKLGVAAAAVLAIAAGAIALSRSHAQTQPEQPAAKQVSASVSAADPAPAAVPANLPVPSTSAPPEPLLSGKDVLVLADLANSTGDPVFDGSLQQALLFQLEQSSFVRIMDDSQVSQALKLLERPAGARLTDAVARDVCRREAEKAMLGGSIAQVGRTYLFTLQATDCQTGRTLAREQTEAQDKDHVLQAVANTVTAMRAKLGESLKAIHTVDPAYAEGTQVTTSSLEALQAFSLANAEFAKQNWAEAAALSKHATELDPNFAMAYAVAAAMYSNAGRRDLMDEYYRKAYALIDHASTQRERLFIEANYTLAVSGDQEKALGIRQLTARLYPRDSQLRGNLAESYRTLGQFEKSLAEYQESVRLSPHVGNRVRALADIHLRLDRFGEAKAVCETALAQNLVAPATCHDMLLRIAYVQADRAAQEKEIQWFLGKPEERTLSLPLQISNAITLGQDARSKEIAQKLTGAPLPAPSKACPAGFADVGLFSPACMSVNTRASENALIQRPNDTILKNVTLPVLDATRALSDNQPDKAVELLRPALPYDRVNPNAVYLRGLAYLRLDRNADAVVEFQKFLNQKAVNWFSGRYIDAYLGLARGWTNARDTARARKAYQAVLDLLKDADQDNRYLLAARKELAALK